MGSASSPLFLSLATIFALLGIVLVSVALGTDDWQKFTVARPLLHSLLTNDAPARAFVARHPTLTYTRTYGLFRQCFPTDDLPQDPAMQTTALGATCLGRQVDYQTDGESPEQTTRMHLMRAQVALYVLGLALLLLCLCIGVAGCWRRSSSLILAAGILLLFSTLFFAGSMALWHGVDYLQQKLIDAEPFFTTWPDALVSATSRPEYGWSYMVSWIGTGLILVSAVMMLVAYRAMKEEEWVLDRQPTQQFAGGPYEKQALPYGYGYGYPPLGYAPQYPPYASPYAGYLTYSR